MWSFNSTQFFGEIGTLTEFMSLEIVMDGWFMKEMSSGQQTTHDFLVASG